MPRTTGTGAERGIPPPREALPRRQRLSESHREVTAQSGDDILVTGIGVVSAFGIGRETYWSGLIEGRCGIRKLELFDTSSHRTNLAAWIDDSGYTYPFLSRTERRRTSRADRFALLAAREAVDDAEMQDSDLASERTAVVLGAGASGLFEAEGWYRQLVRQGTPGRPSQLINHFSDAVADHLAQHFAIRGIRSTVVTACSSSAAAIGQASDLLRFRLADVVVTGGSDVLAELTYAGFNALRVVDPGPCRPFDRERNGLTLGEGAAILLLERRESAERRGARAYCQLAGYGLTADAHHMTAPEPSGKAGARTIVAALAAAGLSPDRVDYVNAHGTATVHNDRAEAAALKLVFGERAKSDLPVSSIKGAIGHCLCSAGGMEAAATALAIARGVAPPTLNYQTPDPDCELDVVPNRARQVPIRAALSTSFAFGGNSACLALTAV